MSMVDLGGIENDLQTYFHVFEVSHKVWTMYAVLHTGVNVDFGDLAHNLLTNFFQSYITCVRTSLSGIIFSQLVT